MVWLKKHWPYVAGGIVALIIIYLVYENTSASSTSTTVPPDPNPGYDYWNGSAWVPNPVANSQGVDTTGAYSANQPATSSSGISSAIPTITPYVSPSSIVSTPSAATQLAAITNPYSTNPNPASSSAPVLPQTPSASVGTPQQTPYNSTPTSTNQPVINAIESALTGNLASSPDQGVTTPQLAIQNTLQVAAQPGGNVALVSSNPYLNSPNYTSLQASILNGPGCCQVDSMGNGGPNSPCCQVATATNEINTGAPTAASVTYEQSSQCEVNAFDVANFGATPQPGCNGAQPTGSLINSAISAYTNGPAATNALPGPAVTGQLPAGMTWAQYVTAMSGVQFSQSQGSPTTAPLPPANAAPLGNAPVISAGPALGQSTTGSGLVLAGTNVPVSPTNTQGNIANRTPNTQPVVHPLPTIDYTFNNSYGESQL